MLTIKAGTVMLSAAKHLCAHPDRPFAEFTLSGAHVLRVTSEGSGDERCPSGRSQATPDYYRSRSLTFFIGQWPIDALPRPIMSFNHQDRSYPVGAQFIGAPPINRPIARRCAPQADKSAMCTINDSVGKFCKHVRTSPFSERRTEHYEKNLHMQRKRAAILAPPSCLMPLLFACRR